MASTIAPSTGYSSDYLCSESSDDENDQEEGDDTLGSTPLGISLGTSFPLVSLLTTISPFYLHDTNFFILFCCFLSFCLLFSACSNCSTVLLTNLDTFINQINCICIRMKVPATSTWVEIPHSVRNIKKIHLLVGFSHFLGHCLHFFGYGFLIYF